MSVYKRSDLPPETLEFADDERESVIEGLLGKLQTRLLSRDSVAEKVGGGAKRMREKFKSGTYHLDLTALTPTG